MTTHLHVCPGAGSYPPGGYLVHLLCLSIRYSMHEDQAKQIFQLLLKVMLSDK